MSLVVFLDTGVLSLITHPKDNERSRSCIDWFRNLLEHNCRVCVPEVCDYELRREYVRLAMVNNTPPNALKKLDDLKGVLEYIPINTSSMLKAADLWATTYIKGNQIDDDKELNIDVILMAQGLETEGSDHLVIATTNVKHLKLFVDARPYQEIAA